MTVIVYITYDNLQDIDAGRSLPVGVTEVELKNWTKTREPDEIESGEKKLNSHSTLYKFNRNIDESDVENIQDLYDSSNKLRGINYVTINSESNTEGNEKIEDQSNSIGDIDDEVYNENNDISQEESSLNINDVSKEEYSFNTNNASKEENQDISEQEYQFEEIEQDISQQDKSTTQQQYAKDNTTNQSIPKVIVEDNKTQTKVTGNKVLRTIVTPQKGGIIRYDLWTLYDYLKSDKEVKWQEDKFVTWDLYTSLDQKNEQTSVEWRMLSAKINISPEQYDLLSNNEAYAVLGVEADNEYGFELIVPYNDIISVFINGLVTSLNYQNRNTDRIYNLDGSNTKYKPSTLSKCKNPTIHKSDLSKHTDFYHFETGIFNMSNTSGLNANMIMETDISNKLNLGENSIDFLVGNFISSESVLNNSYGFSKLNLYIIEKPKLDINIQFYKYIDDEILYFNEDYAPTRGDDVYIRIDITNTSDKFVLNNLDLDMKITSTPLKINKNTITYNNLNIKNNTRCYINDDFSTQYSIDILKELKCGDKVTIMSDKITYSITKNDAVRSAVICSGNLKMNYIKDDFTHIEFKNNQTAIRVPTSSSCGTLNFTCEIEDEDNALASNIGDKITEDGYSEGGDYKDNKEEPSLIVNVSNDNESANLVIKPGQTYKVENLSIDKTYNISLILPQNYIVIDTDTYSSSKQNTVQIDTNSDYDHDIHIKIKKKSNPYFYKNKQDEVDLSFK